MGCEQSHEEGGQEEVEEVEDIFNNIINWFDVSEEEEDTHQCLPPCIICYSHPVENFIFPCGHICLCNQCTHQLLESARNRRYTLLHHMRTRNGQPTTRCPYCRRNVEAIRKFYLVHT